MNRLSRRQFLKRSIQGLSALGMTSLTLPSISEAEIGPGKICVVVQLLGGVDPLLLLPYTSEYTNLASLRGNYARVNPGSSPFEVTKGVALHPGLARLSSYASRMKVIMHTGNAMHLRADRSHEIASLRMVLGGSPEEFGRMGWMARLYDQNQKAKLVGFGGVAESFNCLQCQIPPLVTNTFEELDLGSFALQGTIGGAAHSAFLEKTLREIAESPGPSEMDNLYRKAQRGMFAAMDAVKETLKHTTNYDAAYTTEPAWSEFNYNTGWTYTEEKTGKIRNADAESIVGTHMTFLHKFKNAAQLIKETKVKDVNEKLVIVIPHGSYDLHEGWEKRGYNLLSSLGMSLKIFLDDITNMGMLDNVVVFLTSEFGRTVAGNGQGTDHGEGYPALLIGGKIRSTSSSIVYGDPLSVSELTARVTKGNSWPREVAQERLIVEIIQNHLGLDPALAFPPGFLANLPKPPDLKIFT